jgi:hypothetical protein
MAGCDAAVAEASGIWTCVLDGVTVSPIGDYSGKYLNETIARCQRAMGKRQKKTSNAERPTSNAEGTIRLALKSESILDVIVVTTRQKEIGEGILYGKRA